MQKIDITEVRQRPLVESISEEIENRILSGLIPLGAKVNEHQLAAELKVSRASLREAIRRLEQWDLVEIVPNRGALVRQLGLRDILDLYDLRAGLAHAAGRLLADRASTEDIKVLKHIWQQMDRCVRDGNARSYFEFNDQYHARLFEFTGNPPLARLAILEEKKLRIYLRRELTNQRTLEQSNSQHRAILDAIMAGDGERCAQLFEAHVLVGKQRALDFRSPDS